MIGRRRSRSTRLRGRGQALVEFALVLPIALILLLAVFDVGRAVFLYNGLTNAAREGARLAVVNQDKSMVVQRVQDMTIAGGLTNAGLPNDLVSFRKQLPNADPMANPECTTMATGCVAVVTARSSWTAITPIIGSILGPLTLTARSELPVEFVCPNPNIAAYATSADCLRQP
jgi:Flp pilus assembly protein TadG